MKRLTIFIIFFVFIGCKKSDDGKTDQQSSSDTKVVTVTSKTGRIWMDRNLGATRVAISSTDEESYGDLYQWGRGLDGHQKRVSATTSTLSSTDKTANSNFILAPNLPNNWRSPQNDNLWQGVNGINNPCPIGFRIPTEEEWNAERLSWNSNNSAGAFDSPLKLPMAGGRNNNGSLYNIGTRGDYWSSTVNSTNSRRFIFQIASSTILSGAYFWSDPRAFGSSCRCIKD